MKEKPAASIATQQADVEQDTPSSPPIKREASGSTITALDHTAPLKVRASRASTATQKLDDVQDTEVRPPPPGSALTGDDHDHEVPS
jgi:hypothetical protein